MPRSSKYSSDENTALAKAYKQAFQEDGGITAATDREAFWAKILEAFAQLTPARYPANTYQDRGEANLSKQLCKIKREVKQFNACLRESEEEPSPSNNNDVVYNEEQKINMAVAIHLKKTKTVCDDNFKNFSAAENWRLHGAWLELRSLPQFAYHDKPAAPAAAAAATANAAAGQDSSIVNNNNNNNNDDDIEHAQEEEDDADQEVIEVTFPATASVASPSSSRRRRGGDGGCEPCEQQQQQATKKQRRTRMDEQPQPAEDEENNNRTNHQHHHHASSIATSSLQEMVRQDSLRNRELAMMAAHGAMQFFVAVNDCAKAQEMAMILYQGAIEAAALASAAAAAQLSVVVVEPSVRNNHNINNNNNNNNTDP